MWLALSACVAAQVGADERDFAARFNLTPLPPQREALGYEATFDAAELERIRRGYEPESMDDKWVIVADGDHVRFHRSWSGYCIYEIRLEATESGARVAESWVSRGNGYVERLEEDRRIIAALVRNFLLAPPR